MPFVAGLIFYVPLLAGIFMLQCIPAPCAIDERLRSRREPMDRAARWSFLRRHAIGLGAISGIYFLCTILRSLRDDFAPELWKGLGVTAVPSDYAWADFYVATGVLMLNALGVWILDNRKALLASLGISAMGIFAIVAALLGESSHWISPFSYMVLIGFGLYLPYVAVHTTIFERMIATTRDRGNIGFLMYVVDSLGYAGYVVVMLVRQAQTDLPPMLPFFSIVSWFSASICFLLILVAMLYFGTLEPAPLQAGEDR